MNGVLTYTGTVGPGRALTATVFQNVSDIDFRFNRSILHVEYQQPGEAPKSVDLDLSAIATVTMTVASGVYTITVST